MKSKQIANLSLLPVRDQKRAKTCLAFATSSAHEFLHCSKDHLSPAYLYGLAWPTDPRLNGYGGLTVNAVKNVISSKGQVNENILPYEEWLINGFPNAQHQPARRHSFSAFDLVSNTFNDICALVGQGIPVIVGVRMTDAFFSVDKDGYIAEPGSREMGGHAMVAVGTHNSNSSSNFLLLRNSWGNSWGVNGHALVSESYLTGRLMFAAILKNIES